MANSITVIAALFLIFFDISGLATTNILRLTKGNTLPVLSSKCSCGHCGGKIPPLLQLPIVSFIVCRGKCRHCGGKIPTNPLLLEISVVAGMFLITCLMKFSVLGVSLSFMYYEMIRIAVILKCGKRETEFAKQYIIAVLAMVPFYLIALFASMLYGTL